MAETKQATEGMFWSGQLDSAQLSPPRPEQFIPNGQSSPVFMPTFMKALEMLSGSIPSINIEAKNSTFVDTLVKNQGLTNGLFNLALMLTSSVAELIDKGKNPRTYGFVKFVRNVLALERLRRQVEEKFVVHGGTNMDDWNKLVEVVTSHDHNAKITFVPPGLNDVGTFITPIGCNMIQPSTFYALYKCDADHTVVKFNAATSGVLPGGSIDWPYGVRSYTAESLFRYGPEIQMVTENNGVMKFIMTKATTTFCWMQVIKFTKMTVEGTRDKFSSPFYAVVYMPNYSKSAKETVEISETNFVQLMLIDKTTAGNISSIGNTIDIRTTTALRVVTAFLKKMKFSMFDPVTTAIGVSCICDRDLVNNTRFYSRSMHYSGKDAVHVLPEYDKIRDALGKCLELGMSRGYAFIGSPGTGKTIMMNQLVNEFPESPVVKFSMQGFQDGASTERGSLLQSITDVIQSLSDAGFKKIFLCCDDIDSVDMSTKNVSVENLINLIDGLHGSLKSSTAVIFMCTVNDPTKIHSTIIKRGKRIDEVIEVPCPDTATILRLINSLKGKNDPTDYTVPEFAEVIERMARDKFSLADLSTMMTNLQIYGSPDESGKFTRETLELAIDRIEISKANAAKTYEM